MKRQALILVIIASFVIFSGQAFAASFNPGDHVSYTYDYSAQAPGYGSGGLFTIKDLDNGAVLYTFCIELDEHLGMPLVVGSIDPDAIKGGIGGPEPDPLSGSSKWLFGQYQTGAKTDTGALQIAFWVLEDEYQTGYASPWDYYKTGNSAALVDLAKIYYDEAITHANYNASVKVLNLLSYNSATQKYDIAAQSFPVPEPGIMLLMALGVFGVGLSYRKRN
jgi:hypothetical protein